MPVLTITSPYAESRVDSNTFTMGNPMPESTLLNPMPELILSSSKWLRIWPLVYLSFPLSSSFLPVFSKMLKRITFLSFLSQKVCLLCFLKLIFPFKFGLIMCWLDMFLIRSMFKTSNHFRSNILESFFGLNYTRSFTGILSKTTFRLANVLLFWQVSS